MKLLQLLCALCFVLLFSCKQQSEAPSGEVSAEVDMIAPDTLSSDKIVSSSAAVVDKKSNRKFVRTAELKFKVADVAKSTFAIENTVTKIGGFVASTELKSNIIYKSSAKASNDSIVETTRYVVENKMIIRVPNTLLDSTLKVIAKQVDFLDYRIIKADDVSLQLLSDDLSQKRNQQNQVRVEGAIKNRGKKLGETLDAEDRLYNSQTQSDQAKLSTLSLNDRINFSTVNLSFYQKEAIVTETLVNPDNDEYRTGFGVRLADGLKNGCYVLEAVILFLVNIWTLLILATVLWFVWKKYKKVSGK